MRQLAVATLVLVSLLALAPAARSVQLCVVEGGVSECDAFIPRSCDGPSPPSYCAPPDDPNCPGTFSSPKTCYAGGKIWQTIHVTHPGFRIKIDPYEGSDYIPIRTHLDRAGS